MELREYIAIFRRWWWLLLLGTLLAGGTGYFISQYTPPVYEVKTTLVVGRITQSTNPSLSEVNTVLRLAQSYAQLATREPVLQATIDILGLKDIAWTDLRENISAKSVPDTQLLEITVKNASPVQAKLIVDTLSQQLIQQSPSTVDPEQQAYREFVKQQLVDLQANIMAGQAQLQELQGALDLENTPDGVSQRQSEIDALQSKLNTWQSNYAVLLTFMQNNDEGVNYLTVIDPAVIPNQPITNPMRNTALAAIVGMLIAMGIVFLLEYLDDTIKTSDDALRVLNLTTLGSIPMIASSKSRPVKGQIIETPDAFSPTAEAYRTLRTSIQFSTLLMANSAKTLLVTSSGSGEGKSTTAANLGVVMAHTGKRVILVDSDLRRPVIHKLFDVSNETGLSNILVDPAFDLNTILRPTAVNNLTVLPSGPSPSNAADYLASEEMTMLIEKVSELADVIIFDTPPLLAVTDARILATQADVTLLVIDAGNTRSEVCRRGAELLAQIGVKPLGVILNKFNPKRDNQYYGYGYQYYYGHNGNGKKPKF